MKKIIVFALLLIISVTSFSQQTNPSKPVTKADYLLKSKSQKNAAWVLLGGGTVLMGAGFLIGLKEASFDDAGTGVVMVVMGGIGFLSAIGSIPFFIASGRNKRKGMSLSFKNEVAPQIQKRSFVYRSVPSLTLKISL